MNRWAIFHRTYSEYSFATAPDRVVLRLRTALNDLDACYVCYGDRMDRTDPISITRKQMQVRQQDGLFDYYEIAFDPGVTRLCYYFELHCAGERLYYYNDGFFSEPDANRQLYYNFHYIRREDMAAVPAWLKEAVIYQIYPDSFADAPAHISGRAGKVERNGIKYCTQNGGTLAGIRGNLDYLQNLGINCLYLTPIFAADSWHKYDTADYLEIDPCFGDKKEFAELVQACHAKGIKVILDGVFNHCGPNFFAFCDVVLHGEKSPYRDWFFIKNFPLQRGEHPNYECFAYYDFMPKLNTGNPEVIAYLQNVACYWLKEFDIDGWRLDVANEIDHPFWQKFRQAVKAVKKDAVLLAEIWDDARSFLGFDQFDSAMNYNLTFAITDAWAERKINAEQFADRVSYLLMRYPEAIQQGQMNLFDSHDIPRFLSRVSGDRDKFKSAVLFLLTHVGAPMIFYGDEKGVCGWTEKEYRRPMPWNTGDADLENFYRQAIKLRRRYLPQILAAYRIYTRDRETFTYGAADNNHGFVVLVNMSGEVQERTIDFSSVLPAAGGKITEYFTDLPLPQEIPATRLKLSVRPWSCRIFGN